MKIALVAQNATPLHPRAGSGPDRDDIGLSELTRKLAGQGHQVTVYTQKNAADLPDQAGHGQRMIPGAHHQPRPHDGRPPDRSRERDPEEVRRHEMKE